MTLERTQAERTSNSNVTSIAPRNADSNTARKPGNEATADMTEPPSNSMTSATPRAAPLVIPKMPGPASGLRNAVWRSRPLTASAAPQSNAVSMAGRREESTMNCQAELSEGVPSSIDNTSAAGMEAEPTKRLSAQSTTSDASRSRKQILVRLMAMGIVLRNSASAPAPTADGA